MCRNLLIALALLLCTTAHAHVAAVAGVAGIWNDGRQPSSNTAACYQVQGKEGTLYTLLIAEDGKCWLDRNLGATRAATAFNDYLAYGSLFQWGRLADGHQLITWTSSSAGTPVYGTTTNLSSTDNPVTNAFILATSTPFDWRSPQNGNLWQGVNGTNNVCPAGFRLPTQPEWATYVTASGITNSATAFSSALHLTVAGYRNYISGALNFQGSSGYYWSSSPNGTYAYSLNFNSSSVSPANNNNRAYGLPVRCLKN